MSYVIETPDGEEVISGPSLTITRNQETFEPAVVGTITTEISSNVDSTTEMCGRTEKEKNGDGNWKVEVEGLITQSQLSTLQTIATGETVEVNAAILGDRGGSFIVADTTIKHEDDLNAFEAAGEGRGPSENAYSFQLQLEEPEPDA